MMTNPLDAATLERLRDRLIDVLDEVDAAADHLLGVYLSEAVALIDDRLADRPTS